MVIPSGIARPIARVLRRAAPLAAAVLGAGLLFGLVRFLRADGVTTLRFVRIQAPPADEHNLADWRLGPTVRASGYHRDPLAHFHPVFLVDARTSPSVNEKWVSPPGPGSWIEITWREPRNLERVVLRHAGELEPGLSLASYTVQCLREGGPGPSIEVAVNRANLAVHALACPGARGIRFQPLLEHREVARIYEIEAWGR